MLPKIGCGGSRIPAIVGAGTLAGVEMMPLPAGSRILWLATHDW